MGFNTASIFWSALVSLAIGLIAYVNGKQKLPNIMLALTSVAISSWCFGQFMGALSLDKSAVLFWTRFNIGAAVLIPIFFLHFVLAFTQKINQRQFKITIAYLLGLIFLLLDLTPLFVADVAPTQALRYYPVPGPVYLFFGIEVIALFLLAFWELGAFIRKNIGTEKNQAKYILVASLVGFSGGLTAFFPLLGITLPVISHYFMPLYLFIVVYAIVKHKLLDINLVIYEGLVYSLLTLVFSGVYALLVLFSNHFFAQVIHVGGILATLVVIFTSLIIFLPLRDLVQRWVDRLFFKGEFYYQQQISALSSENLKLYRGLIQADKLSAVGMIAAGMAHEIKNPLASIKGLTQVLPENLNDPDFIRKYSEIVPRQLDRINRIVEDLLDFSHPRELAVGEVSLDRLLDDVLRLIENQCRKGNIEIIREYDRVPRVPADPGRLSQALVNVFLNALQAMPRGGKLLVSCQTKGSDQVEIEVVDSGVGILPANVAKIFDPFFTTKGKGNGMGLAVTDRIIKEHGGEITVESELGEGTTFKICLPIKPKPLA